MVASAEKTSLSPERLAQEAKIASIYADLATKKADNNRRTAAGRAAQAAEQLEAPSRPLQNSEAIYINPTAVIERIYVELESETATASGQVTSVMYLYDESGELYPTTPDLTEHLPAVWETIIYEQRQSDTITTVGEYLAVEHTGFHLEAVLQQQSEGAIGVVLRDREESLLTQLRLSGTLVQGTGEARGRMIFKDDPDIFIHPSVGEQKGKSLTQLDTLIREQRILDITCPQD